MKLYDISSFLLSLLPPQNPPSHPKHPFMYSHSDPSNFPSGSGIYSAQLNLTITCRFDLTCCFRLLLEFPTIDCAPHTHARTLSPPYCFHRGRIQRLEMYANGRSATGWLAAAWSLFHLGIFFFSWFTRRFLFQNTRNIFRKHGSIYNFHIRTIDLPFYTSEMEANSHQLTFCVKGILSGQPLNTLHHGHPISTTIVPPLTIRRAVHHATFTTDTIKHVTWTLRVQDFCKSIASIRRSCSTLVSTFWCVLVP